LRSAWPKGRPILRTRYEAVVDRGTGLALGEQIKLGRDTFTVVGLTRNLVASGGDPVIFITLRDAQKLQFDLTPAAARREAARTPGAAGSTNTVNAILVRLGELLLSNRLAGGLCASIKLPR